MSWRCNIYVPATVSTWLKWRERLLHRSIAICLRCFYWTIVQMGIIALNIASGYQSRLKKSTAAEDQFSDQFKSMVVMDISGRNILTGRYFSISAEKFKRLHWWTSITRRLAEGFRKMLGGFNYDNPESLIPRWRSLLLWLEEKIIQPWSMTGWNATGKDQSIIGRWI